MLAAFADEVWPPTSPKRCLTLRAGRNTQRVDSLDSFRFIPPLVLQSKRRSLSNKRFLTTRPHSPILIQHQPPSPRFSPRHTSGLQAMRSARSARTSPANGVRSQARSRRAGGSAPAPPDNPFAPLWQWAKPSGRSCRRVPVVRVVSRHVAGILPRSPARTHKVNRVPACARSAPNTPGTSCATQIRVSAFARKSHPCRAISAPHATVCRAC